MSDTADRGAFGAERDARPFDWEGGVRLAPEARGVLIVEEHAHRHRRSARRLDHFLAPVGSCARDVVVRAPFDQRRLVVRCDRLAVPSGYHLDGSALAVKFDRAHPPTALGERRSRTPNITRGMKLTSESPLDRLVPQFELAFSVRASQCANVVRSDVGAELRQNLLGAPLLPG